MAGGSACPTFRINLKFGFFYRIGFTPWDGHPLPSRLRELIEGQAALPSGQAIDIGCGTGDMSGSCRLM
jgi:hypothetical protein